MRYERGPLMKMLIIGMLIVGILLIISSPACAATENITNFRLYYGTSTVVTGQASVVIPNAAYFKGVVIWSTSSTIRIKMYDARTYTLATATSSPKYIIPLSTVSTGSIDPAKGFTIPANANSDTIQTVNGIVLYIEGGIDVTWAVIARSQ